MKKLYAVMLLSTMSMMHGDINWDLDNLPGNYTATILMGPTSENPELVGSAEVKDLQGNLIASAEIESSEGNKPGVEQAKAVFKKDGYFEVEPMDYNVSSESLYYPQD